MTHPTDEAQIDALLAAMTLDEQVLLLAGASMWQTNEVPAHGVPALRVSDGPNGARGSGSFVGSEVTSACFPVGIALAASWDPALVDAIGVALGEEAQAKGAHMLLGPTVNMHRSPLNGRNFECYSEDPYLSARIAVAYIQGVQRTGVGATVKHFVCNDSEFERNSINVEVDERTLREIYLPPFAAAVREAQTWGVMSAYNRVNGQFASENAVLLCEILKDEWGFDGIVMSDWFGTNSVVPLGQNGMDLEMPGPPRYRGAALAAAVRAGEVPEAAIADSARRVLRLIQRAGVFADPAPRDEQAIDRPAHRALIRRAGAAGAVLLKNDGGLLPLAASELKTVALIGPHAKTAQIMGGGSAQVNAHYRVSPYDGLVAALGADVEIQYAQGCTNHKMLPLLPVELSIAYYPSLDLSGVVAHTEPLKISERIWMGTPITGVDLAAYSARISGSYTPATSGLHRFSLASAGLARLLVNGQRVVDNWSQQTRGDSYFGFGTTEVIGGIELVAGDPVDISIEYSRQQAPMLAAVRIGHQEPEDPGAVAAAAALAAACDVAIVCVGLNGEWESEGHDRADMELAGQQNALVAAVVAANPRTIVVLQTGSPVTLPWLTDVPALLQAWYPGQECGNAIADVLLGVAEPGGRLPQTFPLRLEDNPAYLNYPGENGRVRYGEGLFVGYRYYDKKQITPLFPFGYGLTYTTFAYGDAQLSAAEITTDETVRVSVPITNTGERTGSEIVQLYIADPVARLVRPHKELKRFARVVLQPGETQTVTFDIDRAALAYWDDRDHAWVIEPGVFAVLIGASAADIRTRVEFVVRGAGAGGGGSAFPV